MSWNMAKLSNGFYIVKTQAGDNISSVIKIFETAIRKTWYDE